MAAALILGKYSLGVGDRFAHQAKAQLRACMMAAEQGVEVIPVWNKSNHVGYKLAARIGSSYLDALADCEASVSRNVTANLFDRHIRPIFLAAK